MKRLLPALAAALLLSCGDPEQDATRAHEAAKAGWALLLQIDGAPVRLPLKAFNVLLFKDEEVAAQEPAAFEIEGDGVHLVGDVPPAASPGYEEKWERCIGASLTIKASGDFHREAIESKLVLPGGRELPVAGGTITFRTLEGRYEGSEGDRTLKGDITLRLQDGRTLQGTLAVHAITWG